MEAIGLIVTLEARSGKQADAETFLKGHLQPGARTPAGQAAGGHGEAGRAQKRFKLIRDEFDPGWGHSKRF
jgi:hypothetical protein